MRDALVTLALAWRHNAGAELVECLRRRALLFIEGSGVPAEGLPFSWLLAAPPEPASTVTVVRRARRAAQAGRVFDGRLAYLAEEAPARTPDPVALTPFEARSRLGRASLGGTRGAA